MMKPFLPVLCLTLVGFAPVLGAMEPGEEERVLPMIGTPGPNEGTGSTVPAEHVVIYKEKGYYTPFPTLLQDGDTLLSQFSRRSSRNHIETANATRVRVRSDDGGRNWKEVPRGEPMPPLPEWKIEEGGLVRVRDGGWMRTDRSERQRLIEAGYKVRDAEEGKIAYLLPRYYIGRSSDDGRTWQEEEVAAPKDIRSIYHHFPHCTTLLTSKGVRLRVLHASTFENHLQQIVMLRSEDDGKNWEFIRMQPEGPEGTGFNESAIVETADGRLLIMMRSEPEGFLWQSFSEDDGKSWSKPVSSGIVGHPPHLLKLPDGRLVCTYGYRRRPLGIRASVSRDHGRSWEKEIILRADGKHRPADQGYPTTVLLSDGSLFTIYYITLEENVTHIAGTRWRLE